MKVVNQNGTLYIGIPQALAKAKNIEKGDKFEWEFSRSGDLVLKAKP